jgi:hypothetical protein
MNLFQFIVTCKREWSLRLHLKLENGKVKPSTLRNVDAAFALS